MVLVVAILFPFADAGSSQKEPSAEKLERAEKLFQGFKNDPQFLQLVQMALGCFGYGTGPFNGVMDQKTKAAILAYQQNRGLTGSGEVNYLTMRKISEDLSVMQKTIPSLSSLMVFTDFWTDGYFKAQGTWIIEQDEMAEPIQTTEIQCHKITKECVEATATLGDTLLRVDTIRHIIEKWDEYEIVTSPKEYGCVRYTMRVLREQQSVTASRIGTSTKEVCGEAASELRLRLDDGMKIYHAQQKQKREAMGEFLQAPGFLNQPLGNLQ